MSFNEERGSISLLSGLLRSDSTDRSRLHFRAKYFSHWLRIVTDSFKWEALKIKKLKKKKKKKKKKKQPKNTHKKKNIKEAAQILNDQEMITKIGKRSKISF